MNRYKKSHKTLQRCESILRDEYVRGTLSEELFSELQARGMTLRPSESWEVVLEERPASPLPSPQAEVEDAPAEPPVDQETVDLDTPEVSPMVEEAAAAPPAERLVPEGEAQRGEMGRMGRVEGESSGRATEGDKEWQREGYGICIGCADTYIVRCDGDESPWAKGSDKPEEKDGKFLIECGDCERHGEGRRKAKRAGGFGGFASRFPEPEEETGWRGTFGRIRMNPAVFEGALRAAIPEAVRGREVPFVTVRGGVAFVEMEEVWGRLPKGADVGRILVERYRQGQRTRLIGHGIGGLI